MEAKNVDDIIVKSMQPATETPASPVEQTQEPVEQAVDSPTEQTATDSTEQPETSGEYGETEKSEPAKEEVKQQAKTDSPIDEYGNPVAKPRTYTEEEVQNMIRDRLSRGRHAEQPTQQQVKQAADDFQADPNSEDNWEVQLNKFIDKRIEDRTREQSEKQWREQEARRQAEFEEKFTNGMNKYGDFRDVVSGKEITNGIMMATRALDNPAAFVYAACKLHPQEINRISQIQDPYQQAAEVGRLHERMVKERKMSSNAPKPLEVPKASLPHKVANELTIEQRIAQYAKQKRK